MLYLASKSPRRRDLLQHLGVEFEILALEVEEIWNAKETVREYVTRVALAKARAAKNIAKAHWPILASDTEVVLDGQILGKPENRKEAKAMLLSLSNRTHEVVTSVVLLHESEQVLIDVSRVTFKNLSEVECQVYCDTDEPYDKAGGYGIQGRAAAFVCRLEGSYSSVMGLPLVKTAELLKSI